MKLFIVRHGEAESLRTSDAERALTHRGIADALALGRMLAQEQVQWDVIIVSPYLRARQTLDSLLASFRQHPRIIVNATITPENAVADAYKALELLQLADTDNVLIVSHMPLVSGLVASLVDGNSRDTRNYPMATASLAELQIDTLCPGGGTLIRLVSPPYNA